MSAKRQLGHGVVVADEANGLGVADLIDDVDAATGIFQAEAVTSQNVLIALRVKLCETLAELKLLTVNHDGTIGALFAFHGILRQGVGVDAEEVTHASTLQLQIASHTVVRSHVDDVFLNITENPAQHVVEMYADISGNASTLVDVTLP